MHFNNIYIIQLLLVITSLRYGSRQLTFCSQPRRFNMSTPDEIGNESAPIQMTQCRFPGLAISSAKILIYLSNKICGNSFIKQHSETVMI